MRDDVRALAEGATAARVEHLPERRAHDQFALAECGKQADDALPVEQAAVLAQRDRLAREVAQRATVGSVSVPTIEMLSACY
jgi:hypothetical protein